MDILFLGGIFPEQLELEIINNSKGPIDFAANNLQWGIINGLDFCNDSPVYLCNLMFIGSYPQGYKKILIKGQHFSHHKDSSDTNLGFFNFWGIRLIFRFLAGFIGLISWAQKKNQQKVVIIYSINTPFLLASIGARFFFPKVKLCLVAADLPEYMSENNSFIYRLLKSIDKIIINYCLKKINAFVLLTDNMAEKLNVDQRPWVRMEGIFDKPILSKKEKINQERKIILYTGTLSERFGLLNVLDAFEAIKKNNYELWICGEGDTKNEIIKRMKKDTRIKYFGQVAREKALIMQREATVLINPRTSEGEFTKYSFPSKIMEYFASGTPTIMHRLPGIPEEYFKYCFIADLENSNGLYETIIKVCELEDKCLNEIGRKAQEFISKEKNAKMQARKIYNLLTELY